MTSKTLISIINTLCNKIGFFFFQVSINPSLAQIKLFENFAKNSFLSHARFLHVVFINFFFSSVLQTIIHYNLNPFLPRTMLQRRSSFQNQDSSLPIITKSMLLFFIDAERWIDSSHLQAGKPKLWVRSFQIWISLFWVLLGVQYYIVLKFYIRDAWISDLRHRGNIPCLPFFPFSIQFMFKF
jgi:hypothetical protein